MPFIDTKDLPVVERLPGWHGRYFNSASMTFAHYDFDAGATIHEHHHEQEEVWHVLAGELRFALAGEELTAGPGDVAIIPKSTPHSVVAVLAGKAIVVDYPLRPGFGAP